MIEYISVAAVTAAGGFALTASPFCQTTQKEPKSLALYVRPLAKARGSFAPAFIRGHRPPVGFAGTYMRCVRLRRTALRANPRINASTQPAEGAGGSRSKAAGELTLGLMSGEKQRVYADLLWERACSRRRPDSRTEFGGCTSTLWERACPRRRPASRSISFRCTQPNCRSLLAMTSFQPTHSCVVFLKSRGNLRHVFQVVRRKCDL